MAANHQNHNRSYSSDNNEFKPASLPPFKLSNDHTIRWVRVFYPHIWHHAWSPLPLTPEHPSFGIRLDRTVSPDLLLCIGAHPSDSYIPTIENDRRIQRPIDKFAPDPTHNQSLDRRPRMIVSTPAVGCVLMPQATVFSTLRIRQWLCLSNAERYKMATAPQSPSSLLHSAGGADKVQSFISLLTSAADTKSRIPDYANPHLVNSGSNGRRGGGGGGGASYSCWYGNSGDVVGVHASFDGRRSPCPTLQFYINDQPVGVRRPSPATTTTTKQPQHIHPLTTEVWDFSDYYPFVSLGCPRRMVLLNGEVWN